MLLLIRELPSYIAVVTSIIEYAEQIC